MKTKIAYLCLLSVALVNSLDYKEGRTYHYTYENEVRINDKSRTDKDGAFSDVGFKLETQLSLAVVWQKEQRQLIKIKFQDVKVASVSERSDEVNIFLTPVDIMSSQPIFFEWHSGKVVNFFASSSETSASVNLKKGIAGLLQLQTVDGAVTEVDSSGECSVTYIPNGNKVLKAKDMESCQQEKQWIETSHPANIMGVGVSSQSSAEYTLSDDGTIHSATSTENHRTNINVRDSVSSTVASSQKLTFVNADEEGAEPAVSGDTAIKAALSQGNYLTQSLLLLPIDQQCGDECQSAADVVATYRESLSSELLAQADSSTAFLSLLKAFRSSGKRALLDVLNDEANKDVVPQILDVVASTQTAASWDAAIEFLDFGNEEIAETLERFLVVTAFNSHPSATIIEKLMSLMETGEVVSEDVKVSLALTVGALIKTVCRCPHACENKIVQDALARFVEILSDEKILSRTLAINALRNAAQPSTMPAILDRIRKEEDQDVIEVILDGLSAFDEKLFTRDVKRVLNNFYHQNHQRYSNVIRGAAVFLLLTKDPSEQDILNIALSLPHLETFELSKFISSKLETLSQFHTPAGAVVRSVLMKSQAVNYANIVTGGFSKSYRNLLADTGDSAIYYELDLQMTGSGLLRKSHFDVDLDAVDDSLKLLSVNTYSKGLESFFGEDTGDQGDIAAGVSVQLMGIQLRPLSFLSGGGNIMSMAWNLGSADTAVSPLHGNVLLHDHSEKLTLQSGVTVNIEVQGSISVDLGGDLDFSIWERTFTTTVFNRGAMSIRGSTSIDVPSLNTGINYGADAVGVVSFVTSVKFASLPPQFCLQMIQDPIQYRHIVNKYERLENSPVEFSVDLSRFVYVEESSFKLFDENSPACREMFGQTETQDDDGWW